MSVVKSSLWFAGGTLCSRLLGVLRESAVAGVFGAGLALDAFLVANRIPNMLRELLAEGALGSSFTKVYCESRERDNEEASRLLYESLVLFAFISMLVVGLGIIFAPSLVDTMTNIDFSDPNRRDFYKQAVALTRILFPFIGLMIMGSIAGGVLHERGRFFLSAFSPVALNLGYLFGALVFSQSIQNLRFDWLTASFQDLAIVGLALGVLLGGLSQTLVQFWGIRKSIKATLHHRQNRFSFTSISPQMKKIMSMMGPMVIASSAAQVNILVNTNFATSLEIGAVTWLTFSFRLLQLPIGLFAVAVGSAALPSFTRILNTKSPEARHQAGLELSKTSELMLWLMTACFCFFIFNSKEIVELVFQHGRFNSKDTLNTSMSLFYYSFSLAAYGLTKVLTAFYYALDRTRFAMKVGIFSIVVNLAFNYFLVDRFGFSGLAMTASCVLNLNALILIIGLRNEKLMISARKILPGVGLLFLFFVVSSATQGLIDKQIDFYSLAPHSLKTGAFLALVLKGLVTLLIFAIFSMIRTKKTPAHAWTMIAKRKSSS